jgi:hypothetical protein
LLRSWPFADPPATTVVLSRTAADAGVVLVVLRDAEGGWQFLDGREVGWHEASLVTLGRAVALDASVAAVWDLPPGWVAWRPNAAAPWGRARDDDAERSPHALVVRVEDTDVLVAVLDHRPRRWERLWLRIRARVRRSPSVGYALSTGWRPNEGGQAAGGSRVPRVPPAGPLAGSIELPEPQGDETPVVEGRVLP